MYTSKIFEKFWKVYKKFAQKFEKFSEFFKNWGGPSERFPKNGGPGPPDPYGRYAYDNSQMTYILMTVNQYKYIK